MDKMTKNIILSIITIAVLFVPVATGYSTQYIKLNTILTTDESNYISQGHLNTDVLNWTVIDAVETKDFQEIEDNNDTYYDAIGTHLPYAYNDVSNVSNVNYVIINWSAISYEYTIIHQLDKTTDILLNSDFVQIKTDAEQGNIYLGYFDGHNSFHTLLFDNNLGNDTYMMVIDIYAIQDIKAVGEQDLFLMFFNPDDAQDNYTFEIECYALSESVYNYDDNTIFVISMLITIAILTPTAILSNDWIDIKTIKNAKKK